MVSVVKKVAAIHDISGYGRSSMTIVIPVLSAMGMYVCPLPTAVLSATTVYPSPYIVDLTEHIQPIAEYWQKLNLKFDAIYSGFLGSHLQCDIVRQIICDFSTEKQLVLVDPVLGDDGKLYDSMDDNMITGMRRLITKAQIITPNLTEACLLLDEEYNPKVSLCKIKQYIGKLSAMGPEIVIITGVPDVAGNITEVFAYDKMKNIFGKISCKYLPANYPGTGDTFASVVCGALLQGKNIQTAIENAVNFVYHCIKETLKYNVDSREGVLQELFLSSVNAPIIENKFELIKF